MMAVLVAVVAAAWAFDACRSAERKKFLPHRLDRERESQTI